MDLTAQIAKICVRARLPPPITPNLVAFACAKYFIATPLAAAVPGVARRKTQ